MRKQQYAAGMVSKRKIHEKKQYTSPSISKLDAKSAKTLLEAKGASDDPHVQEMLRAIDDKLSADKKLKSKLDKSA